MAEEKKESRGKRKINNEEEKDTLELDKTTRSRENQWWFKTNITDGFLDPEADIKVLEPAKFIKDVKEYLRKFLLPPSQEMNSDE
jgi:hypothetical protein